MFRQFLEKKTRLFSFTGGYCREFYVVGFFFLPLRLVLFGKRREYVQLWEFFVVVVGPLVPQHGQHVL